MDRQRKDNDHQSQQQHIIMHHYASSCGRARAAWQQLHQKTEEHAENACCLPPGTQTRELSFCLLLLTEEGRTDALTLRSSTRRFFANALVVTFPKAGGCSLAAEPKLESLQHSRPGFHVRRLSRVRHCVTIDVFEAVIHGQEISEKRLSGAWGSAYPTYTAFESNILLP